MPRWRPPRLTRVLMHEVGLGWIKLAPAVSSNVACYLAGFVSTTSPLCMLLPHVVLVLSWTGPLSFFFNSNFVVHPCNISALCRGTRIVVCVSSTNSSMHYPKSLPTLLLTALVKSCPPKPPIVQLEPTTLCAHRCFASLSLHGNCCELKQGIHT